MNDKEVNETRGAMKELQNRLENSIDTHTREMLSIFEEIRDFYEMEIGRIREHYENK